MKRYSILILVILPCLAGAQKGLEGMINAEKSFASYAAANGAREAFLRFIDSNSIVFEKGVPVNALETWTSKEEIKGVLNWRPAYAEIASCSSFGYTAGPWTIQVGDSMVGRGLFFTLWNINDRGEWKFLVDLGNGSAPEFKSEGTQIISAPKINGGKENKLLEAEKQFIALHGSDPAKAYESYMSARSILNRNGKLPALKPADQKMMISGNHSAFEFTNHGFFISKNGDMGCIYGSVVHNQEKSGYFRVWHHEKDGWKIAMEVLPL